MIISTSILLLERQRHIEAEIKKCYTFLYEITDDDDLYKEYQERIKLLKLNLLYTLKCLNMPNTKKPIKKKWWQIL
jgi:uncharacterized protein with ATP-grasp and redox domains